MKIALLLADEIVREETCRWKQEKEIDETIKPLIYELDTVLNGKF